MRQEAGNVQFEKNHRGLPVDEHTEIHGMGWSLGKVNHFEFGGEGTVVCADGNNVAWSCPCGGPVLFVYQQGRRGASESKPTQCPKCTAQYFLDPQFGAASEPPPGISVAPAEIMRIMKLD